LRASFPTSLLAMLVKSIVALEETSTLISQMHSVFSVQYPSHHPSPAEHQSLLISLVMQCLPASLRPSLPSFLPSFLDLTMFSRLALNSWVQMIGNCSLNSTSPFLCFVLFFLFEIGSLNYLPRLALIIILLIYASWVTKITGMSHSTRPSLAMLLMNAYLSSSLLITLSLVSHLFFYMCVCGSTSLDTSFHISHISCLITFNTCFFFIPLSVLHSTSL
jgi:hypothetical protein